MPAMTTSARSFRPFALIISIVSTMPLLGCGGASQEGAGPTTPTSTTSNETEQSTGEVEENDAYLDVLADPSADVLLDGKPIGKTPIKNFKTTPGSHDVTFVDEAEGNRTMGVTIQPGDHETVKLDLAPKIKEQPK